MRAVLLQEYWIHTERQTQCAYTHTKLPTAITCVLPYSYCTSIGTSWWWSRGASTASLMFWLNHINRAMTYISTTTTQQNETKRNETHLKPQQQCVLTICANCRMLLFCFFIAVYWTYHWYTGWYFRSTGSTDGQANGAICIGHDCRCHWWLRTLLWCNIISGRCHQTELIFLSRHGKIIHSRIEYDTSSFARLSNSKASKLRCVSCDFC